MADKVHCECGMGPYVSITQSHLRSTRHELALLEKQRANGAAAATTATNADVTVGTDAQSRAETPQEAPSDTPDVAADAPQHESSLGRGPGLDPPEDDDPEHRPGGPRERSSSLGMGPGGAPPPDDDPGPRHSSLGMGSGGEPPGDEDDQEPRASAVGPGGKPPRGEDEPPRSGLGQGPGGEPEVQAPNWPYSSAGVLVRTRRKGAMDIIVDRPAKQGGQYSIHLDQAGVELDDAVAQHLLATRADELELVEA